MVNKQACMIIGAAPNISPEIFKEFDLNEYYIICADGGYDVALANEIVPDHVVGDLDSVKNHNIPKEMLTKLPKEKDLTDTMYAVWYAMKKGFKDFVLVGCSSADRPDHTMANYNVLAYILRNNCIGMMVDEYAKTFLISESKLTIDNQKGHTISVFPIGSQDCFVTYRGLKYPMRHEALEFGHTLMGVSNEIVENLAEIVVHKGKALIITLNKIV